MYRFCGKKSRGSLTIFAALSLMLVSQFIFIMIEAARYVEIDKISEIKARSQMESVFAEYCRPLWEEYHLLGLQLGEQEVRDQIKLLIDLDAYGGKDSFLNNMNLIRLGFDDMNLDSYEVLTDDYGGAYEAEIASYMKKNIAYEMARKMHDDFSALENLTGSSDYSDSSLDDAVEVIKNRENYKAEEKKSKATPAPLCAGEEKVKIIVNKTTNSYESKSTSKTKEDSTLSDVLTIKNKGVLSLVLSSEAQNKLSKKSINLDGVVSNRTLKAGRNVSQHEEGWMDKILLELYMENYMSCYTAQKTNRPLCYEYEYLLSGKETDVENLKSVVNQILAIREAANFAYILSDATKMQEVTALATAIAGATLNPIGIALVEGGLIAAWAYCESILDLRALLVGDKIPYIKSPRTWTSGLTYIVNLLNGSVKAISDPAGASYVGYLGFLYLSRNRKQRTYRAMDLQELYLHGIEGYENVRMDELICYGSGNISYNYNMLYLDYINAIRIDNMRLKMKKNVTFSYY